MTPAPAAPTGAPAPDALAPKLRSVQVGLRRDLQVARHLFRGEVTYTVRDPVSFETHAFSAGDYAVLVALNGDRTLGENFQSLVTDGVASPEDEERFYKFVLTLHRSGLLALPISDDRSLYARYEQRQKSRVRSRLMAFLYWKIPLWNPDRFLVHTLALGSRAFTKSALVVWGVLTAIALVSLAGRWRELGAELPTLLQGEQVLTMWALLIVLKGIHEFGHAYACRTFGGAVPEMGISLVLLTPCAYVDASASWSFTRIRDRLIVCFGGMYFESWIAGVAAIVWAFTETSTLHSIAYQTMVLASVTTVGFNLNPLVRFDGYFILSDLMQVPNLRAQSTAYALRVLKRTFVGIDPGGPAWSPSMRVGLFAYAIGASIYRIGVVLGMCAVIALKFFAVGLLIAVGYALSTIVGTLYRSLRYLLADPETKPVRVRAALVSLALLAVPAAAISLPLPRELPAKAVVEREAETLITTEVAGTVAAMPMLEVSTAHSDDALLELDAIDLRNEAESARATERASRLARDIAAAESPMREAIAEAEWSAAARHADLLDADERNLTVRAPSVGALVPLLTEHDLGRHVPAGTPVAVIGSGGWIARALVDQVELASLRVAPGEVVELKPIGDGGRTLTGRIESVAPAGDARVHAEMRALAADAGGDVPVSPVTSMAPDARFEVRIAVNEADGLHRGERLAVRLPAAPISLAQTWYRAVLRFRERLATAE
ncbi:MAG: HlyD family efflux transporter periplasmic adaptor subunit [Phycisphaerae bacterium]|nr:HlyD family efflux transporter periplasmic adaptor subunit [Phycisphaerae bacterium]